MYVSVNIWFLCFVIAAVCCCIHVCSVTGEISQRKRRRRAKTTELKQLFSKNYLNSPGLKLMRSKCGMCWIRYILVAQLNVGLRYVGFGPKCGWRPITYITKTVVSHHRTLLKCYKGLPGALELLQRSPEHQNSPKTSPKRRTATCEKALEFSLSYISICLSYVSSLYEPSASIFIVMNLIPTPRGSGRRLNLPLLVGVELANTLRQLFAQTDSIWVYREIFLT